MGAIPSVGDAMMVVADKRNRKLINDALASFISNTKNIPLPEDNADLLDMKIQTFQDDEIQIFHEAITYDQNKVCLTELKGKMDTERQKIVKRNESILFKQCIDELERLHAPISRDVDRGIYAHKMGYIAYMEAVKRRDGHFRGLPESFGNQKEASLRQFDVMTKAENQKVKADASAIRKEDELADEVKNLKRELEKINMQLDQLKRQQLKESETAKNEKESLGTQLDLLNRQRLQDSTKSTDTIKIKQDLDLMNERVN